MESFLLEVLSTQGFPVTMCLILMWFIRDISTKFIETVNGFKDSLDENNHLIRETIRSKNV